MEGLITVRPDFICRKDFRSFLFSRRFSHSAGPYPVFPPGPWRLCFYAALSVILLYLLFSASPAQAEGQKVFTDEDLLVYRTAPMVDQSTLSGLEEDLRTWEKAKDAQVLRDREKKQKAEEMKAAALQKQKQNVSVTGSSSSAQNSVYNTGVDYNSSTGITSNQKQKLTANRVTVSDQSKGNVTYRSSAGGKT